MSKHLDKVFKESKRVKIDANSKLAIMSDCHRGNGNNSDNFIKNKNVFMAALRHYYDKGFLYVELGDGDDMWEVENYSEIVREHLDVFKLLKKFHEAKRLIMLYGNHDKCKKSKKVLRKYFYKYYDKLEKKDIALLDNIMVYEGLVFVYNEKDIFIVHGHQDDLLNDTLWKTARFLVRYVWKYLENIGINDPTSAAKAYKVKKVVEKRLTKWSSDNKKMVIAGHTHRPILPDDSGELYFNDGSCVHPDGITCIEIENGKITLVKWSLKARDDKVIHVEREVLENGQLIDEYFIKYG